MDVAKSYNCYVDDFDCIAGDNALSLFKSFLTQPGVENGLEIPLDGIIKNGIGDRYTPELINQNIESGDFKKFKNLLLYCIGRGKGLTPGGDDFLIGFLAVYTRLHGFYKLLNILLCSSELTTHVSYCYYKAALNRCFDYNIAGILYSVHSGDIFKLTGLIKAVAEYGHIRY